jgi:hypothetical protein
MGKGALGGHKADTKIGCYFPNCCKALASTIVAVPQPRSQMLRYLKKARERRVGVDSRLLSLR